MSKVIEKNVAELIMITILIVVLMSSCGSGKCASSPHTWGSNCPAYR